MLITREDLALHPLAVSELYAEGELDYRGSKFRQVGDLRFDATAELLGADIRIRGRLGARLEVDCDRCAAQTELPVEQNFDLYYRPLARIAREEEIEIPRDELDVGFYSGEGIEITDVIREQVILALPMKVVCRPECRGLCPGCGANLNKEICRCQRPRTESPFVALLERQGFEISNSR